MKRTHLLTGIFAALTVFAFSSCKKDNGSGGVGLSANLGANAWHSTYLVGVYTGGELQLEAYGIQKGDTSNFSLTVEDNVEIGKPDLMDKTNVYFSTSNAIYSTSPYAGNGGHGTMTITTWDKNAKKIVGTFSGVFYNWNNANDSLVVTNGNFNTLYQVY